MVRVFAAFVVAGMVLGSGPFISSQEPSVPSKLMLGISAEQAQAIRESRNEAQNEISKERAKYSPSLIIFCLREPAFLVAIARITEVTSQPPAEEGLSPNLKVDLELEQILRGSSEKTHVYAESRWRLIKSGYRFGHVDTALDTEEPKVGKQYVICYRAPGYGEDGSTINVAGVIDLSQPGQEQTFADLQHFLNIEASGDALNFAPFLEALDDPVPWIRDIAAYRLPESDACHASRICGEVFLAHATKLLQSSSARERQDGLEWLRPLVAGERARKVSSSISENGVRELLESTTNDPNVSIGDLAFQYLVQWKFQRSLEPGQCLEIVAPIRKWAVWDYAEVTGKNITSPLGDSISCVAPNPEQAP